MNRILFLMLGFALLPLFAEPAVPDNANQLSMQVLGRYFAASNTQSAKGRGLEMDMHFSATLPRMKKEGVMLAKRIVSSLGKISFVVKSFAGDNTVKNYVITKYMAGEVDLAENPLDTGINPKNYKFKYKRMEAYNGRPVHVYELNPRKKRLGLFKGELWIDDETALPVRETGSLVKSPSVFLKRVNFTRTYAVVNGAALPEHVESVVETRIAGKAEIDIRYSNFGADQQSLPATP